MCERLSPGSGFCEIGAHEVDAALEGLGSPWVAVRRHALFVLHDARLTVDQRARHRAALERGERDPDARIRDAVAVIRRHRSP